MTTTPQQQQSPKPVPIYAVNVVRAIISLCETVGFIFASVLALMNNGSDFRHAVAAAFIAFVAHGVNHNAGGSPV